jgi:hypothetical protein
LPAALGRQPAGGLATVVLETPEKLAGLSGRKELLRAAEKNYYAGGHYVCLGYGGGQKKIKHFFAWRIVVQLNRIRNARPAVFDQPRDRTMNGHGGKRPGAGRPKGAASRANEQVRQEAAATGELPLAYMLRVMRDPNQPVGRRDDMAKVAAPFCHSRLSSVEHSGEISRPTVIRAPAVSVTLDEWQAEYAPGAKEKH